MPISGSALLVPTPAPEAASNPGEDYRGWDLFWILHVAWKDGIAERRGIGQVLTSVLENASECEVKTVLLG